MLFCRIAAKQFMAVLMHPGASAFSSTDVRELIQSFDTNGDSEIDVEDFIEACGVLEAPADKLAASDGVVITDTDPSSQTTDPEMDELLKQAVEFLQTKAALFSQRDEVDAREDVVLDEPSDDRRAKPEARAGRDDEYGSGKLN